MFVLTFVTRCPLKTALPKLINWNNVSKNYFQSIFKTAVACVAGTILILVSGKFVCAQVKTASSGGRILNDSVKTSIQGPPFLRKRLVKLANRRQREMLIAVPDTLLRRQFTGTTRRALKKQLNAWSLDQGGFNPVFTDSAKLAGSPKTVKFEPGNALSDSLPVKSTANKLRKQLMSLASVEQQHSLNGLPDSSLVRRFNGKSKTALKAQLRGWDDQKQQVLGRVIDTSQYTGTWRNVKTAFATRQLQEKWNGRYQAQVNNLLPKGLDTETVGPLKAVNEKRQLASQKLGEATRAFGQLKKGNANLNLTVQDELRYKPSPVSGLPMGVAGYTPAKFVNVLGIKGNVRAFGVPFNVDFSAAQLPHNGISELGNELFKFDMDPAQYQAMLKNEVQHYDELRKNVFGGLDLNAYTSKLLTSQLADQRQAFSGSVALSKYLQNPANAGRLLLLDEQQASATILQQLHEEAESKRNELRGLSNTADGANAAKLRLQALAAIQLQQQALRRLSGDALLANYVNDPFHKKEFTLIPEQQVADKLMAVSHQPEEVGAASLPGGTSFDRKVIGYLAHQIALKGIETNYNYQDLMKGQSATLYQDSAAVVLGDQAAELHQLGNLQNLNSVTDEAGLQRKAADAAASLQELKKQLRSHGFEPSRLMQLQQLLNTSGGTANLSELQSRYFQKAPSGSMQQIFSLFSGFKAGSFGSNLPGSTRDGDLFLSGTRVTFKSNNIPITLGYGGQNDIKSLKDDQFQNTIYNSPRNVAFFSAEMKGNRWGGPVKVSVLGSYNQQQSSSLYSLSTVSSNNVVFTLSKNLSMGKMGKVVVDVSKSTTIYPNTFIASSEAILNQKAGVVGDPFYQSLAFGLTHHLDLESAGMVNDVYFNYAGMGYQNPGNNGLSGAEMKFGGKFKKTAYDNRLMFELRSDFRNQPISYTSNSQWQTLQVQFTTRYKFSSKVNMSLQYSNNSTSKKAGAESFAAYGLQKLQLDGGVNYKIGKNYTNSHFTLGAQSISNGYLAQAGGRLLMLNYNQVLLMDDRSLTATMFVNKELSAYKLIGNMINSDLTYQLPASKSLYLITGLTYLRNMGMAHQAGVKEGLQYSAGNFDIASTVDLRKNLMTPLYPDLYSATQAEFSISYHFIH